MASLPRQGILDPSLCPIIRESWIRHCVPSKGNPGSATVSHHKGNKKVLLREHKRHTDRGVSSTTQLGSPPWPGLTLRGECTQGGVPPIRVPLARSDGGYPKWGTPLPSGYPRARSERVYPRWDTPPSWGTPHQGTPLSGYPPPHLDLARVPPHLDLARVPPPPPAGPDWGTPPPAGPGRGTPPRCGRTE